MVYNHSTMAGGEVTVLQCKVEAVSITIRGHITSRHHMALNPWWPYPQHDTPLTVVWCHKASTDAEPKSQYCAYLVYDYFRKFRNSRIRRIAEISNSEIFWNWIKTGPQSQSLRGLRQSSLGLFDILKLRKPLKNWSRPVKTETGLSTGFNIKRMYIRHIILNFSFILSL